MNTVQHKKSTITKHQIVMRGPIAARDIRDFIHQADQIFEAHKGRVIEFDDDYYVTGDEDGLTATFETEASN